MKILYICNRMDRGEALKACLAQYGHEVFLWSPRAKRHKFDGYLMELRLLTKYRNIDVLISETLFHGSMMAMIRQRLGKLQFITYAKGDGFASLAVTRNPVIRYLATFLHRLAASTANHNIYASCWIRDMYAAYIPKLATKNHTIVAHAPAEIFIRKKRSMTPNQVTTLVYVGNFNLETKALGVPILIQAVQHLHLQGFAVRLDIIGQGTHYRRIKRDYDGISYIIWNKYVGPNTLLEAYYHSDVFVYHSYSDACPTTVMEAQACGLPVVTTCLTGAPELIIDGVTGLIAEPDPISIADKIAILINGNGMIKQMSEAAIHHARNNLTWELSAKQINSVLERI